jgi:hypothetical protein
MEPVLQALPGPASLVLAEPVMETVSQALPQSKTSAVSQVLPDSGMEPVSQVFFLGPGLVLYHPMT